MFISLGCAHRTLRMLLRGSDLHLRPNSCGGRGAASLFSCCGRGGVGRLRTTPRLTWSVRRGIAGGPGPSTAEGAPEKRRNPPEVLCRDPALSGLLGLLRKELLLSVRDTHTLCLSRAGAGRRVTLWGPSGQCCQYSSEFTTSVPLAERGI